MPRYFTLRQAEQTLPQVESAIRKAIGLKAKYQEAEEALRALTRKVVMSGGMTISRDVALNLKSNRDIAASDLQEIMNRIQDFGCLVKDLDIGLLDFPTLYRGTEVYLCWKLGETAIEYWHGVDEGYRGRKPVDADFLQNHRGDALS